MMRALLLLCLLLLPGLCGAKSFLSPRHSGLEPPGEPKRGILPGVAGHVDAYGNTLTDRMPEERKRVRRPRPGAYGGMPGEDKRATLPASPIEKGKPMWNFR